MTDEQKATPRRRTALWVILLLLAAVPSGYLYLTGRQDRLALQRERDDLAQQTEALTDSLDGARSQLLLDAALASVRAGDYETARTLTSEFFDRVDRRTRTPGAAAGEMDLRMDLLGRRDQAITELTRRSPDAASILHQLASLHLGLADPGLNARAPWPTLPPSGGDTLRSDSGHRPGAGIKPNGLSTADRPR